ncbi:nidogen [Eupeodes corollae]|uniref:nidogen n=1 Tax=Eupeodes corollae TaxID=290404 RepID=UPI0024911B1B|nr:nidogen [Eupeodes corollae]XP_055916937.1 nidogen [Eupeodes corollae]
MTSFCNFAQFLCMTVIVIGVFDTANTQYQHFLDSSNFNELYRHTDEPMIQVLKLGDSESAFMQTEIPIHFYSEKYDHIYINTNGILTFLTEFPEYLNQPFPLEYPSIAPFFSNVDTSGANDSTTISLFKSQNPEKLQKTNGLIRSVIPEEYDFEATTLFVATWEKVGYYDGKTDKLNTFQAVIICNEDTTYVQFIYPKGGINWLQADTGELGLPDVRAQAGFIAEDGRFFTIDGSGTDNARYFSEMSNVNIDGVFLYHVGLLDFDSNISDSVSQETETEAPAPRTCAEGNHGICHSSATCFDKSDGFCCKCLKGYYGNGMSCVKNTVPIRVSGSLSGNINNQPIDAAAKLQSYIVMQDGRSYTAINPISHELGAQLKLALPVITSIGWLFAKPLSADGLNGYQLTGGKLVHNSELVFKSGEVLYINQTFDGLNYWDQQQVKIDINGHVPQIGYDEKIQVPDYIEEITFTSRNSISMIGERRIEIPSRNNAIEFEMKQQITFDACYLDHETDPTGTSIMEKVSKITLDYFPQDQALRTGLLAKIGADVGLNPCSDGSANCGENTVCVPDEDSYNCICMDGFAPEVIDGDREICVDIDECQTGSDICDDNALCRNTLGGYTCMCLEGYFGNGHECSPLGGNYIIESTTGSGEEEANTLDQDRREEILRLQEEQRRAEEARRASADERWKESQMRQEQVRIEEEKRREEDERRIEQSMRQDEARREGARKQQEAERNNQRREFEARREEERRAAERIENERRDQVERQEAEIRQNEAREEERINEEQWESDRRQEEKEESETEYTPEQSSDCYRCSKDANCVEGHCECREGHKGNGFFCEYICRPDESWEDGKCVLPTVEPSCSFFSGCSCPEGYDLSPDGSICRLISSNELPTNIVTCDVEDRCHENATCEWSEQEMGHICICLHGFAGDGFKCSRIDESCTTNPALCGVHATCEYNESIGKSECKCEPRYEGDGINCKLAPECRSDVDCGQSAYCDKGVCQCNEGFERDLSDFCVPAGMCGGTYCADNAMCKWDNRQHVQYCECMEGYQGDGVSSCKSIPTSCRVRNTCGVHATCEPSRTDPALFECICNPGFYGDGYLCIEEQNCQNTPSLCDPNASCQSINSGIACVCKPGYLGNGTICRERPTYDSGFLLISQGVVIVRVPFNGKQSRPISVASMAIGLDKDCIEGRVYWGDISAKKIMSAKYDSTDTRPFITDDIESPEGIAIDSVSRRIYWTDSVKDTIEVASLEDRTMRAVLVNKHLVNPRGIAVDPYREKLYWSDWNRESPKIEMSDLDGTGRQILLDKSTVMLPNSLVVLKNSGELCFADAGNHKIGCIDGYTNKVRTVASDLSYPFGLSATDNSFYWTDWTTKKLERVDFDGTRHQGMRSRVLGSHKMYGMTAVEDYCPQGSSPCQINNGGCPADRICLSNRNSPSGKSCKCTKQSKTCDTQYYDEHFQQFI